MNLIDRAEYLNELKRWKDEKVIKVITGIRRCGKSTLMKMFSDYLINDGAAPEQLLSINFEDLAFEDLHDYRNLYQYIEKKLLPNRMNYIFLDEIQMVDSYQKAVDSLYIKDNVDLYITGSNAYLLSGELGTLLSGRYVEINLLPLSFKEYRSVHAQGTEEAAFADYLRVGGMPYIATMSDTSEKADVYLEGIYNTIIVKDIEARQQRIHPLDKRRVTDIALLKNIARFLAGSVGNPISVKSIANYITSSGRSVSPNTINDYLEALVEPYIFYPAERFDVEGKQLLRQNRKYYIADLGIRRHIVSKRHYDLGFSLENVVFLELRRRGYRVNVGKVGAAEVDFVAAKGDEIAYFQVTASMTEESTFARELSPLQAIHDNYPKYVLTLDRFTPGNYDGIKVIHAIDWLLA